MDGIRAQWLSHLVSTAPAGRETAEAGLRQLYAAAGLPEPKLFFWFGSPFRAAGATALLCGAEDSLWGQLLEGMDRDKRRKPWLDDLRAEICRMANADWAAAVKAAGPSLLPAQMMRQGRPMKSLQQPVVMSRIRLYKDVGASSGWLNTKDPLYIAEKSFRDVLSGQGQWSAINPMLGQTFYQTYMFLTAACDEAELGAREAPPALAGLWAVARSAGLWWPFDNAVVISDRPSEVHLDAQSRPHRGDGPAITFRDGERAWAWEGRAFRREWIEEPEKLSPRELKQFEKSFRDHVSARTGLGPAKPAAGKPSAILKADLPAESEERLGLLRHHNKGRLPFYERYVDGQYEKVWAELLALGPAVRQDPHAADALAVAFETMRRVNENVVTVAARLDDLGYEFTGDAHKPPGKKTRKLVDKLEKRLGALPLSLRAFYEVVGSVDWIGRHPALMREGDIVAPDPLVVFDVEDVLNLVDSEDNEAEGVIPIAPDDLHKADVSGGPPYEIAVPELAADGKLLNERHALYFVEYLRLVFRHGGFPGYSDMDGAPQELARLSKDLAPF